MAGNALLRHAVPLHDLGRKPRAGDRRRRRRRAAAHRARRARHPALARPAPARPVALHDAAPGADEVKILSGVRTARPPARRSPPDRQCRPALEGLSQHQADKFRPGHADYTYWKSNTASATIAAAAAPRRARPRRASPPARWRARSSAIDVTIRGALVQIGPHAIDRRAWDWAETEQNPFWCPDAAMAARWADYLDGVRKAGSSAGAVIEIVASGVPAGLGEPIYDKLDGDLARAMMTINAVKGVEIGAGFAAAALTGEENADEMRMGRTARSRSCRTMPAASWAASRPGRTSSCASRSSRRARSSSRCARSTAEGNETEIETKGRHDPCVGIRAVPVGEAMMACVLADHLLRRWSDLTVMHWTGAFVVVGALAVLTASPAQAICAIKVSYTLRPPRLSRLGVVKARVRSG
jgi:chorismate synthase